MKQRGLKPKKKRKGKKDEEDAAVAASPAPSSSLVKISSSDDLLVAVAAEELAGSGLAAAASIADAAAKGEIDAEEPAALVHQWRHIPVVGSAQRKMNAIFAVQPFLQAGGKRGWS